MKVIKCAMLDLDEINALESNMHNLLITLKSVEDSYRKEEIRRYANRVYSKLVKMKEELE